jgi:hypothetical protein
MDASALIRFGASRRGTSFWRPWPGAIESLEQDLSRHSEDLLERALHLNEEIDEAIKAMRKKVTPTKAKKERSPSEESLELLGTERTKGKGVKETRPQKRPKEEQSAVKGAEQKTPRKAVATPKPYYRLVTPDQWEKNKQDEGTYRLDHAAWRGEQPESGTPLPCAATRSRP